MCFYFSVSIEINYEYSLGNFIWGGFPREGGTGRVRHGGTAPGNGIVRRLLLAWAGIGRDKAIWRMTIRCVPKRAEARIPGPGTPAPRTTATLTMAR